MKKNKILIITGGTGGHVIPAINFFNYLKNNSNNVFLITDNRGYKYIGNILRSDPNRLVYRVVTNKYTTQERGSMLMDVPAHSSLEDLTQQVMDKATWNSKIVMIPS